MAAEQVLHIASGITDLFALLVQLELIEANVGDLVGQRAVLDLEFGQRLLLLVENPRQQQAALQHADLLVQRLVGLVEVVQLLTGLQVLLGQGVEALRGAQQIVGKLEVERALPGQQTVGTGALGLA